MRGNTWRALLWVAVAVALLLQTSASRVYKAHLAAALAAIAVSPVLCGMLARFEMVRPVLLEVFWFVFWCLALGAVAAMPADHLATLQLALIFPTVTLSVWAPSRFRWVLCIVVNLAAPLAAGIVAWRSQGDSMCAFCWAAVMGAHSVEITRRTWLAGPTGSQQDPMAAQPHEGTRNVGTMESATAFSAVMDLCDIRLALTGDHRVNLLGAQTDLSSFFGFDMKGKLLATVLSHDDEVRVQALLGRVAASGAPQALHVALHCKYGIIRASLVLAQTAPDAFVVGIHVTRGPVLLASRSTSSTQTEWRPEVDSRGTETHITFRSNVLKCKNCLRPPKLPSRPGRLSLHGGFPRAPGSGTSSTTSDGGDDYRWCHELAASPNFPGFARSLNIAMKRWRLSPITHTCCHWHQALNMATKVVQQLKQSNCDPAFCMIKGWQCTQCRLLSPLSNSKCAVCGAASPRDAPDSP